MSQNNPNPSGNLAQNLPSGAPQKSFWTVGRKLLFPSVAMMAALALGLIIYSAVFTVQRNQAETAQNLTQTARAVASNIEGLQDLALGLATEMANSPQVQAAFAAKDRQLLTEIALPTFEVVQKDFGVKQYQFILPPATSFLRLHQLDKYGDDLSAIRFTVLEANSSQKPVSGIELGRGGLGVRGEVPVFFEGKYIGVVDAGLDIGPAYLEKIKQQYGVDVQILLEKQAAQAATFQGATAETSGPTPELLTQASTFAAPLYAAPTAYARVLKGETVVSQLASQGKTYSILSAPLKDYSGAVIGVLEISLDQTEIIAAQYQSLVISILLSLLATLAGGFILVQFINHTLQPVKILTEAVVLRAAGDLEQRVVIQSKDEFGALANAFNEMTQRLREMINSLETRVADRTKNLELAAEVGRTVSQVRALNVMLTEAAELIRQQFGLYYVQVYLTNPSQTALVLQSGTGAVGAELLGRAHQLPLNTASINGRAVIEKRSVVVADTAASASFKPNPLLPETRSEMAVPLLAGEKVVGVLDLQSQQINALNPEILPAFEALAGQLAIAIQNANTLAETEAARAEVEKQAARLSRANWADYLDAIHQPEETGFIFEQNKIALLTQADEIKTNALSAPIAVTGETLGTLAVEMAGQAPLARASELVNIVARQVSQQIESLRLLENAERYRAEAEAASRRITREGWQSYTEDLQQNLRFVYDLKEVRPAADENQAEGGAARLPLKVRDETIGSLVIQGLDEADNQSLELASAVADRLSAHIENLRQFDQTQIALAQTEKLSEASLRFARATNLQELLTVVSETLAIPAVNRVVLGVFNYNASNEMESMDIAANWWNGSGHQPSEVGRHYTPETLNILPLLLSDKVALFEDTFHDGRINAISMETFTRQNVHSMAVLPLFLAARQIGVLFLESEEAHTFSTSEIRLFSALAPQIATVLENRRQFERAQKQAEREAMLNAINQKIQSATSVEAVLQIAARELGHALGAPRAIAQLSLKDSQQPGHG